MEFEDCVKFANENPVSWIANVDGDIKGRKDVLKQAEKVAEDILKKVVK